MTAGNSTLSELERDAVTELANIGISRAAASLRKMVGQQVFLSVPSVDVLSRKAAGELISERESPELVAVQQAFSGPFSGQAMLIFPRLNSLQLIRAVIGNEELPADEAAELEDEALAETGNVILNGCLGTIANMLRQSLQLSLPEVRRGTSVQLFDAATPANAEGLVLFLYINFSVRDRDIRGYIAMLMDLPALSAMQLLIRDFIARYVPDAPVTDTSASVDELRRIAGPIFAALEHSGVALAAIDPRLPDSPFVFVNDAFTLITGYGQDIIGKSWHALHGPESDRRVVARLEKAMRDGTKIKVDLLSHRKDGTVFRDDMYLSPVLDADGKPAFFLTTHDEITEERQAKKRSQIRDDERQEVLERLRATLSVSGGAAAWEWRVHEGRIVGDGRFAGLYGITPEEAATGISANTFFSIVHPDDQTRIRLAVDGILQGADVFTKQYRILLPNGIVRWVHARGHCQFEDDKPVRFTGVFVDITEQKRIEEQLRIAQTSGGIGTFEYIDGFATVSVSSQFCKLLGLHPTHDLPVRTINAVVSPDDPPLILEGNVKAMGDAGQIEFRIVRPDNGEVRWLTRRGEYLHDADTAGLRFSGVVYDITHSKRTEEQLRDLNDTLETRVQARTKERDDIWQLSQDLLGIADQKGRWLSVNPAWTKTLGWKSADIVGKTSQWLQAPDDAQTFDSNIKAIRGKRSSGRFQSRFRTRNGDFKVLAWTAVLKSGYYYCAARDISEQLRQEETLARAEDQLRQSQKMEAVGQLTGGIAHDFNNMLTGITASIDLIRRRLKAGKTSDVERYLDAAASSAQRAATLTQSLLTFARRQSLDISPRDVNGLIETLKVVLQGAIGESITLEFDLSADLQLAMTDANQLENAILNLAINARDAMPDGGRLIIRTGNVHLDDDDSAAGDYILLSVTDTGVGMPPNVVAQAFDPFFTTKPFGKGTGLGLSMIYGFVKQSGGHVRIESIVGQGTTIKIYLPRATSDEPTITPTRNTHVPEGRGETVLVVEDDQTVRLLVTQALADLSYESIEFSDPRDALPLLQSDQPIDLLVTDVGLPNMNGRQLAEFARQHRPSLKILFITGYAEKAGTRKGFLEPGMEMLSKPFTLDALGRKIRELIEEG